MTIRTFWTFLIKILGIWLVLDSFSVIFQFLASLPFWVNPKDGNYAGLFFFIGVSVLTIFCYAFVLWLFVFKTAWLIDKLQLDKGFVEDKIEFKLKRVTVLSIAIIVLGGLIFAESLPQFCRQIFTYFQQGGRLNESPNAGFIIFHLVKSVIGYLLMTNSQTISNFIDRKSKTEDEISE